jgi:hypothetical protein
MPKMNYIDINRERVLKSRKVKPKLNRWKRPEGRMANAHRIAHFLDWAADTYPGYIFLYEEIAYCVSELSAMPRNNKVKTVQSIRGAMSAAANTLRKNYSRALVSERGVGVRATINELEKVQHDVAVRAQRYTAAGNKLTESIDVVVGARLDKDVKELVALLGDDPEVEEMSLLAEWYHRVAASVSRKALDKAQEKLQLPEKAGG